MDTLHVLDPNLPDIENTPPKWELLCQATGDVTVPAGKALRLSPSKEAVEDLSPLSRLGADDIQALYCRNIEMADDQLQHISNLTGLKELNLWGTGILGTGLEHLAKLDSLERLWLGRTHVGDNKLAHLLHLDSLQFLYLRSTPTTDAGMAHVGKITSLEILSLGNGVGNEGLVHLRHMTKLKRLHLWQTRVNQEGLIHLRHLDNLEHLRLGFDVDRGLKHLSNMASLKSIRIDTGLMTPKEFAMLSNMKSLEEVSVNCSKRHWGDNTSQVLKELAQLLELKSLHVCRGLTDEGLVNIATMQSLQELSIMEAEITGDGIAALAAIPSLRKLYFAETSLPSERQWHALGTLSSLETLRLSFLQSAITDAHIANLSRLSRLKYLSISPNEGYGYSHITDKALSHISRLRALEHLSLSDAKITAAGLQQLIGLSALQHITLENCEFPQDSLQQFKEKRPTLRWTIY